MKRLIFPLITCLLFMFASCSPRAAKIEPGVSHSLAVERRNAIEGIPAYELSFQYDANKKLYGYEKLSFELGRVIDLQIDFKADAGQVSKIIVNGRDCDNSPHNEHILIPAGLLERGSNLVEIEFIPGTEALNISPDYLYTLFVPDKARTAFPCFDQPDIKSVFTLTLTLPADWECVANATIETASTKEGFTTTHFSPTLPLPTYLFSFAAGRFHTARHKWNDRVLTLYYRPGKGKDAQITEIFKEVEESLDWLEDYTGIKMPFPKYDLIAIPGFQFGGMEHPGAILYRDSRIFTSNAPTPSQLLGRMELIAHETSHLWFGDLVTMRWFDDVWTKEVFANYMAHKIVTEKFPEINHELNFLKAYQCAALDEDRTLGTHSVRQDLDNLADAGLVYGNIIYDKAPVMMRKLEELISPDDFKEGLREYLCRYSYSNADWNDLIKILAMNHPRVKEFSHNWVDEKGLPTILCDKDGVHEHDPFERGLSWRQDVVCDTIHGVIIPNSDGRTYGRIITDRENAVMMLGMWNAVEDDTMRQSVLMTLYECATAHIISPAELCLSLARELSTEENPLICASAARYINKFIEQTDGTNRIELEEMMVCHAGSHRLPSCRQDMIRILIRHAATPEAVALIDSLWNEHDSMLMGEKDYMNMAYCLALRDSSRWKEILNVQRQRLSNSDRIREFDFVSRACSPSRAERDSLFESLSLKENRSIEPWAASMLSLLNHPLRASESQKYIAPGLRLLPEIQATGDIFFPRAWLAALLDGHHPDTVKAEIERYIDENEDLNPKLRNKLLQKIDKEISPE